MVSSSSPGIRARKSVSTRSTIPSRSYAFCGVGGTSCICSEPIKLLESFGQNCGSVYDARPSTETSCVCTRLDQQRGKDRRREKGRRYLIQGMLDAVSALRDVQREHFTGVN